MRTATSRESTRGAGPKTLRQDLNPLLQAHSVAIVGISRPGRFGGRVYTNLRDCRYPGVIYGVNPNYDSLYGQPCYPSLHALPEQPNCAILAVPNERLLPVLQEAAVLKIPAAVIFASAYSEPVEGQPSLQAQLAEVARSAGMVVCGPNCMGFHAFGQRLSVSGYPVMPDTPGGSVTFVSHSGSAFDAVWQNKRGLRFNYLVSSGNEMVTSAADYMLFALTDPTTRVIGLFIETVRDPQRFVAALAEAAEQDVPIVALKVGRSARGAELAQAHSGALAGEDGVYEALFAHYGVQRVRSLDEMLDTLELFAAGPRPPTRFVSAIHDSGAERALLVDLADSESVSFAPINETTTARLAEILEPGLLPTNPLDAWGTGNEYDRIYRDCLLALDSDPATGLNVFAVDLYSSGEIDRTYIDLALAVQTQLTKPLVFLSNLAASASDEHGARLRRAGIPVLLGTENGLRAIRHLLDYAEYHRAHAAPGPQPAAVALEPSQVRELRRQLERAGDPLDEFASKQILRAYGISTPVEGVATSLNEALRIAERIGYPAALKTAAGVIHKSDRGGVRLNLRDAASLAVAYRELESRLGPRVLVQQMVPDGVELILGLVSDAQFGPMLALGMGGIFVEVRQDARLLVLPTTRAAVRGALRSLRGAGLLNGARGQPPADVEAVVDMAMRIAALAADLGDRIAALDVNPLIALPDSAVAVDALIVPRGEAP